MSLQRRAEMEVRSLLQLATSLLLFWRIPPRLRPDLLYIHTNPHSTATPVIHFLLLVCWLKVAA